MSPLAPPDCMRDGACLLINPRAAQDEMLREIVGTLREQEHTIHVRPIWEHGDVRRVITQMYDEGVRAFVAAGGDGTLHEALQVQCQCEPDDVFALGALPYGTGNDFVRTIYTEKVIAQDPHWLLPGLLGGEVVEVDMGCLNQQMFINAVSIGHGAEATDSTPQPIKNVLGHNAYALWGIVTLNSLDSFSYELTVDDEKQSGEAWLIVVGNGRFVGGGFQACPKALLQDRKLDLVIVPRMGAYDTARAVRLLLSEGRHLDHEQLIYMQSDSFTLEVDKGLSVNADGEAGDHHHLNFSVRDSPARWLVPRRIEVQSD